METKKSKKSIVRSDERQTATSEANTQALFKTRYTPPAGRAFWELFKKALSESKNPEDDLNDCVQTLEKNEQVINTKFESEVTELQNEFKLAQTETQKADAAVKLAHFFLEKQIRLYSHPSKPLADLAMLVAFESNVVAQIQRNIDQLPEEQRLLAFNMLYAMVISLVMGIRQREQKRGKKFTSGEALNEADSDSLNHRKYLPAIADAFAPAEFEEYVDRNFPPSEGRGRTPLYIETTDNYLKKWKKKYGGRRATAYNIDRGLVKAVMKEEGISATQYEAFRQGIKRELTKIVGDLKIAQTSKNQQKTQKKTR